MSQQFCLKWNNHTTNMLQVFESLLTTEALVDVTLACDGLSLKAHKMVLSACSPFFQSLFLENPCKHPIVIMKDMRYCDLKAIIDFMYRGEVNVSHDQLSALLKTAETLKVKGLAEVTGENKQASGIVQQEIVQQNASTPTPVPPSAQRTDTPPLQGKRKRGRPRKRSLSDSNRSDDEGVPPKIKEPNSDIEELSGDASMEATSDNRSGGGPVSSNSQSQVPIHSSNNVNTFSKSHLSTSQDPQVEEPASGDENEFEVEPSKLLEQTLTTENVPSNSQNSTGHITLPSVSGLEISRRSMSSTDSVSQALVPVSIPSDSLGSNLQGPDSPQDVKPQILSFDDPPISPVAGTSHGSDRSLMMYMDQSGVASIPGPSNFQDNSALVPHDSQPQGIHERGNVSFRYKKSTPNHMCETTRLLKEIKEDPICFCHSNNSDLMEVPLENELNCSVHKENMKCLKRSKQLLIYNEEGCMKGIELNKGVNSESSSNFNDLQLSSNYIPIQDNGTFPEDEYSSNRNFQSNNLPVQSIDRNLSFVYKPRIHNNTMGSDAKETVNLSLVPQSYTHYTVTHPVRRNKTTNKRGPRKSAKKQAKKSRKMDSSVNRQSGNERTVPCTVQSYTQVSVEEVHLAQSNTDGTRPRRNITKKSASEMLMLRRKIKKKIVQSTSIEYKAKNINQEQYSSSMDTKISVHRSQKAGVQKKNLKNSQKSRIQKKASRSSQKAVTRKKVSRKVKALVKKKDKISRLSTGSSSALEKYGPDLMPPGWNTQVRTRKSGKSAGQIDVYFITPEGKRLRSRVEMAAYLLKKDLPFSAEEFCFRKTAYKHNMLTYDSSL